jgi:hypothetical protein
MGRCIGSDTNTGFVVLLAVDLCVLVIVIPVSITSIWGLGHLDSRVLAFLAWRECS